MAGVNVKVNMNSFNHFIYALNQGLCKVQNDYDLKYNILHALGEASNKYVPKDTGKLRSSRHIESGPVLVWSADNGRRTDYADIRYLVEAYHYTTPETKAYWIEDAQNDSEFYSYLESLVEDTVKRDLM